MIADDLRVISDVFVKLSQIKHCGKIESTMGPRVERTPDSLYSTEISHYRLWFLEYKLTRVNSVHGRPWWNLFIPPLWAKWSLSENNLVLTNVSLCVLKVSFIPSNANAVQVIQGSLVIETINSN